MKRETTVLNGPLENYLCYMENSGILDYHTTLDLLQTQVGSGS